MSNTPCTMATGYYSPDPLQAALAGTFIGAGVALLFVAIWFVMWMWNHPQL